MKRSVLFPFNSLNRGVTVNRCWQSDKMKDSRSILEETVLKVGHNQAITVTDLAVMRGRAQNNS